MADHGVISAGAQTDGEGAVDRSTIVRRGAGKERLIAAGGIMGAIAATSCCILPLGLTVLGVSGAWMANLRALAPFQPYVIAATLAVLAYGFYLAYGRRQETCSDGATCARPLPNRLVKGALWLAAGIVTAAITFEFWFPYILPYLP